MNNTDREHSVVVDVGPCRCSGAPHTTDTVTLREKPDMAMRFAIVQGIREAGDDSRLLEGFLASTYLRLAPASWNLTGPDHKPVGLSDLPDALGLDRAMLVADRAGDLYTQAIIAPLVERLSTSPEPTPTDGSTSPTPASPWTSPEPSLPSEPVPTT